MIVKEDPKQITLVKMAFAIAVNNLHAKVYPNFEEVSVIFGFSHYRCHYSGEDFVFYGSCKIAIDSLMVVIIHRQQRSTGTEDFCIDPYSISRSRDAEKDYEEMHKFFSK